MNKGVRLGALFFRRVNARTALALQRLGPVDGGSHRVERPAAAECFAQLVRPLSQQTQVVHGRSPRAGA